MDWTYLDNNATTPVAPEAIEAMRPALNQVFGNPSSTHAAGQRASALVEEARQKTATCIGADPSEIVFTAGGTESNNLAIRGHLATVPNKRHFVTSPVEHEAVLRVAKRLAEEGYEISYVPVDRRGILDLDSLRSSLRDDTAMVSIMLANNETGVIFPIQEIAAVCREKGVLFHTDAVQGVGKTRIHVHDMGIDFLSLSSHKFHGPKGTGALYIRKGLEIQPLIRGGSHERGLRAGTLNVPGIVGMGVAAELVTRGGNAELDHIRQMRDEMEQRLLKLIPRLEIVGRTSERVPNTSCLVFDGTSSQDILIGLSEKAICVSGGSACHSGAVEPSKVLAAMGFGRNQAASEIRISLSRYSTRQEIDHLLNELPKIVRERKDQSVPVCGN